MQKIQESDGELVYRLFRSEIEIYINIFYNTEIDWFDKCITNINPQNDISFVNKLQHEDRTLFWLDKYTYFLRHGLLSFTLMIVQKNYIHKTTWIRPPFFFCQYEEEMLYILYLFIQKHELQKRSAVLYLKLKDAFNGFTLVN